MAQQNSIVTNVGLNLQAAKAASGEAIVFTHIALGDGDRIPAGGETTLENENYRAQITNSGVEPAQLNTAYFEIYVPAEINTFTVQEIGLISEDGTLYALTRTETPIIKYGPDSTTLFSYTFRILVTFSDLENIVVQMSPIGAVTGDTLPDFMPWATQEEFDASTENRIAQILQVKTFIAESVANTVADAVGNLIISAANTPPSGAFECNGAALSRESYPKLFARIGVVYGAPDADTFNIPDHRGVTLRGWDNGRGLDPSRVFGSYQADDFESHEHILENSYNGSGSTNFGQYYQRGYNNGVITPSNQAVGGVETRGKNNAQLICIIHD